MVWHIIAAWNATHANNLNSSDISNHGSLTAWKRPLLKLSVNPHRMRHRLTLSPCTVFPGQAISRQQQQIAHTDDPESLFVFACGANLKIAVCALPNIPVRTRVAQLAVPHHDGIVGFEKYPAMSALAADHDGKVMSASVTAPSWN